MGLFRRIAAFFGLAGDEANEAAAGAEKEVKWGTGRSLPRVRDEEFSVQFSLAVEKPSEGPVLIPCGPGEGGVQGFGWYTKRLRVDEDGDVAHDFLHEVMAKASSTDKQMTPRFEVKYRSWAIARSMRKEVIAVDGNVKLCLDYEGKLRWV